MHTPIQNIILVCFFFNLNLHILIKIVMKNRRFSLSLDCLAGKNHKFCLIKIAHRATYIHWHWPPFIAGSFHIWLYEFKLQHAWIMRWLPVWNQGGRGQIMPTSLLIAPPLDLHTFLWAWIKPSCRMPESCVGSRYWLVSHAQKCACARLLKPRAPY